MDFFVHSRAASNAGEPDPALHGGALVLSWTGSPPA